MNFFQQFLGRIIGMGNRQRQTMIFTLIAAFGLILIAVVVFMYFSKNQFKTFETDAIRISYPASWEVKRNLPGGVIVGFVSPRETALDTFQENLTVIVQDLSLNPMSLRIYAQTAEMQIKGFFKEQIAVEFSGPVLVAGMTGHKLVYKGANPNAEALNLKAVHIICMKGDLAYQLTFTALTTKFDKYEDVFNRMVSSFQLK